MNFLDAIFKNLARPPDKPILQEIQDGQFKTVTTGQLLGLIRQARTRLRQAGLRPGDRCALLGSNSIRWVALDLAILAEGAIVVPLYHRQAASELVAIMKDCAPRLLCCASEELRDSILPCWQEAPSLLMDDKVWDGDTATAEPAGLFEDLPLPRENNSPAAIIYTSGTSGDAKGVVLNAGNITFMLEKITQRLVELMKGVPKQGDDRVFHYAPFCFAGSWMMLLTCLLRKNNLMLSTDLSKLLDELKLARPHYFQNVPALLERVRSRIDTQLQEQGGIGLAVFKKGEAAWKRDYEGKSGGLDHLWISLARRLVFSKIKEKIGPNLVALICGSAPLSEETQLFFHMLGITVLQVYGLTETAGLCTMDEVSRVRVGYAGPAIAGTEMELGENNEILVRGPHVFPGYWNRPQATAEGIVDGWFHTGDQGTRDETGNWKITGRIKNLIIPTSGHNISPEPIEQMLSAAMPEAEHVIVVGNGRKFLSALITGNITDQKIRTALESVNPQLPHYCQIRRFYRSPEPFTPDNGLLTALGKFKRTAIEARYKEQIDRLYK